MENALQIFENPQHGKVRGYLDENNTAWFNAEDIARGLGFVDYQEKLSATSGRKTYEVIRWARVNGYLKEFGFVPTSGHGVGKDDYLPENMVYRLAMKANNAVAQNFQAWLANEVVPSIRKTGGYSLQKADIKALIKDPKFLIALVTELQEEQAKNKRLTQENAALNQQVAELTPKANYCDIVLRCNELVTVSVIAKDYGKSARDFNQVLHKLGVQYKQGDIWLAYQKYARLGWTSSRVCPIEDSDGNTQFKTHTCWTQKGRLGLYNLLKEKGILPIVESEEPDLFKMENDYVD